MKTTHANSQMSASANAFNKYDYNQSSQVPEFTPQQVFVPCNQGSYQNGQNNYGNQS